jgi:hypothetical protein
MDVGVYHGERMEQERPRRKPTPMDSLRRPGAYSPA